MDETTLERAKNHAMKYLAARVRSEYEMRSYLAEKGYPADITDEVIFLLCKYSYLDDLRFAKAFVSDGFKLKKWGDLKIKYELSRKGVSSDIIALAIDEAEIDRSEIILSLIRRKSGNEIPAERKEKQKLAAYLNSRGFLFEDIGRVL